MNVRNPVEDIASSVYRALAADLPDIEREVIDWSVVDRKNKPTHADLPRVIKKFRPNVSDIEFWSFYETWSTTALGFNGLAGQAFTTAVTVVIRMHNAVFAVYWGGRLGYLIDTRKLLPGLSDEFIEHLREHTKDRRSAKAMYGDAYYDPDGPEEDY